VIIIIIIIIIIVIMLIEAMKTQIPRLSPYLVCPAPADYFQQLTKNNKRS